MKELKNYIVETYLQNIVDPTPEELEAAHLAECKPVTVRLHKDVTTTADNLSRYLKVSRQQLLSQIIDAGMTDIFISLAEIQLQTEGITEDRCEPQEWIDHVHQRRLELIREFAA